MSLLHNNIGGGISFFKVEQLALNGGSFVKKNEEERKEKEVAKPVFNKFFMFQKFLIVQWLNVVFLRNKSLTYFESFLLTGRKPIEPEKYYNMPIDSSDEENEQIPRARIVRYIIYLRRSIYIQYRSLL